MTEAEIANYEADGDQYAVRRLADEVRRLNTEREDLRTKAKAVRESEQSTFALHQMFLEDLLMAVEK